MADETDLLDGIARHLDAAGLVTYDPDGITGSLFIESTPPTDGTAVVLTEYDDGTEPDSKLPYDEPRFQVKVRGDLDPRTSKNLCKQIRSELHGLGPLALPNGTELILAVALQPGPASLGPDENRRHSHSCNFRAEIVSRTTHRA